ncbi:MAG: ferric reductase-like transmembrane domain-containing protein [bacterium]|nr:ferric reductase-like transmembrane domain-containing protein [bacterium]
MRLSISSKIGWPLTLGLSFVPLIIWAIWPYSLDQRFLRGGEIQYAMTMTAIGQMLGLVGMAMFALNLVLSARLKWLESIFGGMNKIYIVHHTLGGLAFILLLLHPLFLIARYLQASGGAIKMTLTLYVWNPACVADFSLFSPDCSTMYAVSGLSLMILFLVITFFVKLPYPTWKLTHKFLGLAFFFASLHVLTIPSDVTTVTYLKYYMFFLVIAGFLGVIYRTVLGFIIVPRVEYVIDEVRAVNETISEIVMHPKNEKKCIRYTPGQFIFIGFPDVSGLEEVHPFSLSSQPEGVCISIGVKALGDYTKRLRELKPGMRAIIEGPFGRTSYVYYPRKSQIWIAGGIGITPFLGMARSLKPDDGYKVDLYYSILDRSEAAFFDELEQIAAGNPNFRLISWFVKEKSFISAANVVEQSGGVLGKEIFLCGPPPMMKALRAQFGKWKVPVANIHSEEFSIN